MKIILITAQWDRCEKISSKLLYCNDIIILNIFINEQRDHCAYSFIANIILQNDQNVCVFHKRSKSIIWFITIDAFTFTNDLFANLNRFIELRCSVFFMFFEFMIALFAHEFLSRRLVILFFNSIRLEIDEDSKEMFDFRRSFFFLFLILIIFHFEKAIFEFVIEIVNEIVDKLMTNRNTLKTICDSFTKYNRIRVCRTCFVSCFFSRRILHFDDHAMCSRSSHVSHILYFSVIDESHSLMWCLMTHFSHTTTIRQCFFICSYFWQLKHCRRMQFLINRSHFLISKIFMRLSKSIRLIISTMIIFICNVRWMICYHHRD